MTAIEAFRLQKTYAGRPLVRALDGVSLTVGEGERVAIIGRSGAGKSTLLNILGLLDEPTEGNYRLLGVDTHEYTGRRRDELRSATLGFVFQENHILGHRSVAENLDLKLAISAVPHRERKAMISRALESVALRHREHALGRLLSGGEKQRLSVARAIIARPRVVLADEPTGNLDDVNASNVLALLDDQAQHGVSVVVITHDHRLAQWADRQLVLENGALHPHQAHA